MSGEPNPKRSRTRRVVLNVVRIGVCFGALWFVAKGVTLHDRVLLTGSSEPIVGRVEVSTESVIVHLADGTSQNIPRDEIAVDEEHRLRIERGLYTVWANSAKGLLLLALALYLTVPFFQAARLLWLLGTQGIHLSFWDSVKLSFAGNFLNFATPLGSNAGDVFKAYFVTTHTDRKTEAATTIVLDRVIGLATLLGTVALITTAVPPGSRLAVVRPYVLAALAAGVALMLAYRSAALRARVARWRWWERLPAVEHLRRIDHTAHTLMGRKKVLTASVAISLVLQVLSITAYFLVAITLAMKADIGNVLEYFAYFYTGAVIQALPGPPQGLGTVELAYRYFFAAFGSPSQIIFLAFLIRAVVLSASLPGLLVTLTGSYRPRRTIEVGEPAEPAVAPAPAPIKSPKLNRDLAVPHPVQEL